MLQQFFWRKNNKEYKRIKASRAGKFYEGVDGLQPAIDRYLSVYDKPTMADKPTIIVAPSIKMRFPGPNVGGRGGGSQSKRRSCPSRRVLFRKVCQILQRTA